MVLYVSSFNNKSIEAWPQNRIEKISNSIDALNPFEEKKIFLLHQYFQKVLIYSLIVKEEFRYH